MDRGDSPEQQFESSAELTFGNSVMEITVLD